MVVVAESLGRTVLGRACTIPDAYLVAELVGNEAMNLDTEVEACADAWGNSIK